MAYRVHVLSPSLDLRLANNAGDIHPTEQRPSTVSPPKWAIIFERCGLQSTLILLNIPFLSDDAVVLEELKKRYRDNLRGGSKRRRLAALFMESVIDQVTLDQGRPAEAIPITSHLLNPVAPFERDELLARFFPDSHSLRGVADYALEQVQQGTQAGSHPVHTARKAWIVQTSLDKRVVSGIFVAFLSMGVLVGGVVGLFSRRADIGITLSAAMLALCSCLQALVVWVCQ